MKTLTLNLDDQLYEILNRYSEGQLVQALKSYAQREAAQTSKTPISELSFEEKRERLAQLAGSCKGTLPERDQPIAETRIELQ